MHSRPNAAEQSLQPVSGPHQSSCQDASLDKGQAIGAANIFVGTILLCSFDLWKDVLVLLLALRRWKTGGEKKSRRTSLPPSSRCPIIAPAGVDRISTDVHKSRRGSTKQQANQQLHTRNPRNNKEQPQGNTTHLRTSTYKPYLFQRTV